MSNAGCLGDRPDDRFGPDPLAHPIREEARHFRDLKAQRRGSRFGAPARATRGYPEPFAVRVAGRERRALGDAFV
jgi:hypothetical protein